jgi:hypothetical protein
MMPSVRALMLVVGLVLLSSLVAAAGTWNIYTHAPLPEASNTTLRETFLSENLLGADSPTNSTTLEWRWWAWSDETGSSWPNDDAVYRLQHFGLNASEVQSEGAVVDHTLQTPELLTVDGTVKVVAAEDSVRFVTFELNITPRVNLSNQTLMYLVLSEDVSRDHHGREAVHLVREMRPEIGFSLRANNTTQTTVMLAAEHLTAAGVDLAQSPTGWRYTVAVFGGSQDEGELGLMVLKHDRLPSPAMHLTPSQTWLPVILTACTLVLVWSVVNAASTREAAIPALLARWTEGDRPKMTLTVQAGSRPFRLTKWEVEAPWAFARRPATRSFSANERLEMELVFKELHDVECHLETGIEVDEMGAWRQHVWLPSPVDQGVTSRPPREEE